MTASSSGPPYLSGLPPLFLPISNFKFPLPSSLFSLHLSPSFPLSGRITLSSCFSYRFSFVLMASQTINPTGNKPQQQGSEAVAQFSDATIFAHANTVSTINTAAVQHYHGEFQLPKEYRLSVPKSTDRMYRKPFQTLTAVSTQILRNGVRFPLHPFISDFLSFVGIGLTQLVPNAYIHLVCFIAACHERKVKPALDLFFSIFKLTKTKEQGFRAINRLSGQRVWMLPPSSNKGWHSNWFYVSGPDTHLIQNWGEGEKPTLEPLSDKRKKKLKKLCKSIPADPWELTLLANQKWLQDHGLIIRAPQTTLRIGSSPPAPTPIPQLAATPTTTSGPTPTPTPASHPTPTPASFIASTSQTPLFTPAEPHSTPTPAVTPAPASHPTSTPASHPTPTPASFVASTSQTFLLSPAEPLQPSASTSIQPAPPVTSPPCPVPITSLPLEPPPNEPQKRAFDLTGSEKQELRRRKRLRLSPSALIHTPPFTSTTAPCISPPRSPSPSLADRVVSPDHPHPSVRSPSIPPSSGPNASPEALFASLPTPSPTHSITASDPGPSTSTSPLRFSTPPNFSQLSFFPSADISSIPTGLFQLFNLPADNSHFPSPDPKYLLATTSLHLGQALGGFSRLLNHQSLYQDQAEVIAKLQADLLLLQQSHDSLHEDHTALQGRFESGSAVYEARLAERDALNDSLRTDLTRLTAEHAVLQQQSDSRTNALQQTVADLEEQGKLKDEALRLATEARCQLEEANLLLETQRRTLIEDSRPGIIEEYQKSQELTDAVADQFNQGYLYAKGMIRTAGQNPKDLGFSSDEEGDGQ